MDFSYYGRLDSIFIMQIIIFVFSGFLGSYKTYLARAKVEFKVKGRKQSHAQKCQTPYIFPRAACRGMKPLCRGMTPMDKIVIFGHAAACPDHAAACH